MMDGMKARYVCNYFECRRDAGSLPFLRFERNEFHLFERENIGLFRPGI